MKEYDASKTAKAPDSLSGTCIKMEANLQTQMKLTDFYN